MRLQELIGKEIINLTDATRLGVIRKIEVLIDTETGRVESLLVPYAESGGFWRRQAPFLSLPWRAIRRLGQDLILVEVRTPAREERHRGTVPAAGG